MSGTGFELEVRISTLPQNSRLRSEFPRRGMRAAGMYICPVTPTARTAQHRRLHHHDELPATAIPTLEVPVRLNNIVEVE